MAVAGVPVGRVRLGLTEDKDGFSLEYASESLVRRGPVLTRNTSSAHLSLGPDLAIRRMSSVRQEGGLMVRSVSAKLQGGALLVTVVLPGGAVSTMKAKGSAVPSALAPLIATEARRCVPTLEESTGRPGEACGALSGTRVEGSLLGEAYLAELKEGRIVRLEFPKLQTIFTAVDAPPLLFPPPDLFGSGVATRGLIERERESMTVLITVPSTETLTLPPSSAQEITPIKEGLQLAWTRTEPGKKDPLPPATDETGPLAEAAIAATGASDVWSAAKDLATFVSAHVTDKRPAAGERSVDWVYETRRGSCVGHTELFLALARRRGIPVRRAIGLVAAGDRFWAHTWAQVKVGSRWFDVDPTDGSAPAHAPRLLLSVAKEGEEGSAARLLVLSRLMEIRVLR